ncbi:hypothetical protein FKW77_005529 [Venturia effusa]|uniref:DUF7730 domain-containing protein n=1 Tax=Venturia effusa TaxID=50376 RepID=A0A517KZH3_9PEZI|nr:hypothetical protein FKW77_005529 [Venturia effusa]
MARRDRFRTARIEQRSAFLKLPGEIRTLIYRAALVKNTPIDLWPHKFIENNRAHAKLVKRLQKTGKDDHSIDEILVRDQHDLNYVRTEMATGLLAACKQVNREARMLFWRENTFRFSGDFGWRGLRRFLISIGPEARSRIRSLEVSPPVWIEDHTCQIMDVQQFIPISKIASAKNYPKLHMAKAFHVFDAQDNSRLVCEMLRGEQTLPKLNLVIMGGWQFGRLDSSYYDYPSVQTSILFDLWSLKHFCTVSVVLESGSVMTGPFNKKLLNDVDISLVAQPGSRVVPERSFKAPRQETTPTVADAREITDLQIWPPLLVEDVLTEGLKIFDLEDRIDAPARGGKAHKSTYYGRRRLERRLKGFGGCRFVERNGEYCNDCNQQLANPWETWRRHQYWCVHCKGKSGHTWKQGIEVRKISRERRLAQRAEAEGEDAWWQG